MSESSNPPVKEHKPHVVAKQIKHNIPMIAGVPYQPYEPHEMAGLGCWCLPVIVNVLWCVEGEHCGEA